MDETHIRYTYDLGADDKRGNLYKELNVDLRMIYTEAAAGERANLIAVWGPFMKTMMNALAKVPKLGAQKFWRGRPEKFARIRDIYKAGRMVTWASFTSVSKNFDQAAYLARWDEGCVLELSLPVVFDISKFSFFPSEEEGIIQPGAKFVVLSDTQLEERTAGDSNKYLVKVIGLQFMAEQLPLIS